MKSFILDFKECINAQNQDHRDDGWAHDSQQTTWYHVQIYKQWTKHFTVGIYSSPFCIIERKPKCQKKTIVSLRGKWRYQTQREEVHSRIRWRSKMIKLPEFIKISPVYNQKLCPLPMRWHQIEGHIVQSTLQFWRCQVLKQHLMARWNARTKL